MTGKRPARISAGCLVVAGLCLHSMTAAASEDAMAAALGDSVARAASVQIAHIIANALIRIAAIAAGVYVVWLGHNTMVRGIKGDFEFEGKLGKLKGSTPGLLFVLLGVAAIGWALGTKLDSELNIGASDKDGAETKVEQRGAKAGSAIPYPGEPPPPPPGDS